MNSRVKKFLSYYKPYLSGLKLRSLRRSIGFVQQDVYLFAGTVIDNIRYGNLNASEYAIKDRRSG